MSLQPPPARTGVDHLLGLGWWKRLHRTGAMETEATMPANPTKSATILKLLRRPKGASIAQLQNATDWQAHSIRAALTGLRKKGHGIERSGKDRKGATVYRMAKGA
jgi:hypothetical protein